jgi:hypothetical protein
MGDEARHRELLGLVKSLPCRVILSGYWSQLYADELADWRTTTYQTVNRRGRPVTEWLWHNFPAPLALHDYRYLGDNYRERERINRKTERWASKLDKMPEWERAWLSASILTDYRGREQMKRKQARWMGKLNRMHPLERRALLSAIADSTGIGDERSANAKSGEATRSRRSA